MSLICSVRLISQPVFYGYLGWLELWYFSSLGSVWSKLWRCVLLWNLLFFTLNNFVQIIYIFLDRPISKKPYCNMDVWSTLFAFSITSHKNEGKKFSISIFFNFFFLLPHAIILSISWFNFRRPHCIQILGELRNRETSLVVLVSMYDICPTYLLVNTNSQLIVLLFFKSSWAV